MLLNLLRRLQNPRIPITGVPERKGPVIDEDTEGWCSSAHNVSKVYCEDPQSADLSPA